MTIRLDAVEIVCVAFVIGMATLFQDASGNEFYQRAKGEMNMDPRSFDAASSVMPHDRRFALLIDADNVSAKYIKPILDELSKYGTVTYKRIYGDWTLSLHAKWKSALLENSITPIQQFGYTQGKNATDSAMIIDAMDILYTNSVEGFCIVSSDSDFTRLAARIRESGLTVIGMGEKKTPVAFRMACDVFTTLELLLGAGHRKGAKTSGSNSDTSDGGEIPEATASKAEIEQAVVGIITDNTNNGKATGLGEIGSRLQKRYPDFDVRSYGTNLLSKLLSEFSSVKIAKNGSNVTVELVEGVVGVSSKEDKSAEQDRESPEAATAHEGDEGVLESEEGESHRTRRRRRGRRGGRSTRLTLENGETPEDGISSRSEAESAIAEEDVQEAASETKEEAPASRRTRRRRRGQEAEAPVTVGERGIQESEDVATEGDAKTRKAGASKKPRATAKTQKDEGVADDKVRADEEQDDEAPRLFLTQSIRDAGEEGLSIGALSKMVRRRFKTFRVTKTGFRNLRLYVASFPGVEIEKREDDSYAVMR